MNFDIRLVLSIGITLLQVESGKIGENGIEPKLNEGKMKRVRKDVDRQTKNVAGLIKIWALSVLAPNLV